MRNRIPDADVSAPRLSNTHCHQTCLSENCDPETRRAYQQQRREARLCGEEEERDVRVGHRSVT